MTTNDFAEAGAAAARGTLLGFLLRILSFFLTQLTVRLVDPVTLGRASIRLELLLSTSLFVGREGFRLALTKTRSGNGSDTHADHGENDTSLQGDITVDGRVNNVAWLSIPTGVATSGVALAFHLRSCRNIASASSSAANDNVGEDHPDYYTEQSLMDFHLSGIFYCIASLIEMLAEPLVIGCMKTLDVDSRAKAEGSAAVARAASLVLLLSNPTGGFVSSLRLDWLSTIASNWPVSAFGMSQMVHSVTLVSVMYIRKWRSIHWPHYIFDATKSSKVPGDSKAQNPYRVANNKKAPSFIYLMTNQNFDLATIRLVVIFTVQSLFKHVLTEGDRIVLTTLSGSYDQGIYAMASSYGGMASRLLLQPLEENARLLFARQNALLCSIEEKIEEKQNDNIQKQKQHSKALQHLEALRVTYATILRLVLYIGLLFACIASNYTSVLLRLLAGRTWGANPDATAALSAFCLYTALLAINGTTEAFVYGVASHGGEVGELGVAHAAVGAAFAAAAPTMVAEWGTVGLVGANCAAMALRSLYSMHFAARYFCRRYRRSSGLQYDEDLGTATTLQMMRRLFQWVLPHPAVLMGFLTSSAATRISSLRLSHFEQGLDLNVGLTSERLVVVARHVIVGVVCVLAVAALAFQFEREFGQSLKSLVWRRKD